MTPRAKRFKPTAVVNEAWLRLAESTRQEWGGLEYFFSAASEAMRRLLVDDARRKLRIRHCGRLERADVAAFEIAIAEDDEKCLRVNGARSARSSGPEGAEVVKLRVFAGLRVAEIAAVLSASEKTVQRDWIFAKARSCPNSQICAEIYLR